MNGSQSPMAELTTNQWFPPQPIDPWIHFPFRVVPNPLLKSELQRSRWLDGKARMRRYLIRALLLAAVLTIAYGIGDALVSRNSLPSVQPELNVIVIVTIAVMLVLDFFYLLAVIAVLNREMVGGQWDLLRVTGIKDESIFETKYVLAQIDSWRPMCFEMALRLVAVLFVVWSEVWAEIVIKSQSNGIAKTLLLALDPIAIAVWAIGVGIAICYVSEPLWRMKMFTALGLAIAAQVRSFTFALLLAPLMILAVHSLMIAVIVGTGIIFLNPGTSPGGDFGGGFDWMVPFFVCAVPLFVVLLTCFPYFFYKTLRNHALDFAFKRLFRS